MKRFVLLASAAIVLAGCYHPHENIVRDPPCLPAPPPHMPSAPLPEGARPDGDRAMHDEDRDRHDPTHQERSCERH